MKAKYSSLIVFILVCWSISYAGQQTRNSGSGRSELVFGPGPIPGELQAGMLCKVHLSMRDKYGQLGIYDAAFVVETPDNKTFVAQRKVEGDAWAQVVFPDDFNNHGNVGVTSGTHSWKATINGVTSVHGKFTLYCSY